MKRKLLVASMFMLMISESIAQTNHVIGLAGDVFTPSALTINQGDMVTWTNNDTDAHTSTSGTGCAANGTWNSGTLSAGQSFSRTFDAAGSFPYFCEFHCALGMVGTITVNTVNGIASKSYVQLSLKTYPNPFEDRLELEFDLINEGDVSIEVYSLTGVLLRRSERSLQAGKHSMTIDAEALNSGSYICKVFVNGTMAGATHVVKK